MDLSRRNLLATVPCALAGMTVEASSLAAAPQGQQPLTIPVKFVFANRSRGTISFDPLDPTHPECLVSFRHLHEALAFVERNTPRRSEHLRLQFPPSVHLERFAPIAVRILDEDEGKLLSFDGEVVGLHWPRRDVAAKIEKVMPFMGKPWPKKDCCYALDQRT